MLLLRQNNSRRTGLKCISNFLRSYHQGTQPRETIAGLKTPIPSHVGATNLQNPFFFETGYALFAKRPSRPFPPPFLSPPSGSFSDPLSTHNRSRDRRPTINGELIRGITNGDDAVLVNENFIGANDGVGAWAARKNGHAALWSRLILHFWALEAERFKNGASTEATTLEPDPVKDLQTAYEQTVTATTSPNQWNGTTTACGALLHYGVKRGYNIPILYVTNLGDSQCLVIRPKHGKEGDTVFKTTEQWHWFDCPRQLGTNSPDTPKTDAVLDKLEIEEDDVVLTMSDGVVDNLWEHEILENVIESLQTWDHDNGGRKTDVVAEGPMLFVAKQLVKAAREIAENPYAESPFMERAVEEGLAMEGGKLDDISVAAARCRRRETG